jgi:hypothetical protein
MTYEAIFKPYVFGQEEKIQMDCDGHFLLPGILTDQSCEKLIKAMKHIEELVQAGVKDPLPNHNAAEYDSYLESLIAHPQMLALARSVLGENIRFDHCVTLNRPAGNAGLRWHSHEYAEDEPSLGFVRIFFYISEPPLSRPPYQCAHRRRFKRRLAGRQDPSRDRRAVTDRTTGCPTGHRCPHVDPRRPCRQSAPID